MYQPPGPPENPNLSQENQYPSIPKPVPSQQENNYSTQQDISQQQNLYPAQSGPVQAIEPILPPNQIQGYGQPIPPVAMPYNPPPSYEKPTYEPPPQNQQQPIVVQQYAPTQQQHYVVQQQYAVIPQAKLKTPAVTTICPFCKNNVTTIVETNFNILSCCFCYLFPLFWLLYNVCADKEFCCSDATHTCPQCGNIIGKYKAC